jgi:hydroxyacylglutathione hydrolase
LARVGIENVRGYLDGGVQAWRDANLQTATIRQISVAQLKDLLRVPDQLQLIDVRRPPEYKSGHAPSALAAPLSNLRLLLPSLSLDEQKPTAVICAGGYRSSAGSSILEQAGFRSLLNVTGGTKAWISAGYETET